MAVSRESARYYCSNETENKGVIIDHQLEPHNQTAETLGTEDSNQFL
jgi:hypothetical protein